MGHKKRKASNGSPQKTGIEDVNKEVYTLMIAVDTLKTELNTLKESNYDIAIENLSKEVEALKKQNSYLNELVPTLIECITVQDRKIAKLETDSTDLKARSMRRNVLLHNVPESTDPSGKENAIKIFENHFKTMKKLDSKKIEIERAHRVGPPRANDSKPRPLVAALTSSQMTEMVLRARGPRPKPTDKQNNNYNKNKDPWITPQLPPEMLEERKRLNYLADHYRKIGEQNEETTLISIKLDKLRVNKTLIKPPVEVPSCEDMLRLDNSDKEELRNFKFEQIDKVSKSIQHCVATNAQKLQKLTTWSQKPIRLSFSNIVIYCQKQL